MERKEQIKEASAKFAEHPHFTWDACSLKKGFQAGAKWADKTMIAKACKWLEENKDHPFIGCEDPCLSGYLTDKFIEEFKKVMEE